MCVYEVLSAMLLKTEVFWDVTLSCGVVDNHLECSKLWEDSGNDHNQSIEIEDK
jgi:hypothetical protein